VKKKKVKKKTNRRKSVMAILFAVVMIASALVVMSSTIFISGAFADNSSSPNEVPDDYISPSDTVSHDGITFTSKADQDPVLKWPFYGAETTDHTITFGWYNIEGAQKYLLQVDNNPDFSSPEIETNRRRKYVVRCMENYDVHCSIAFSRFGPGFEVAFLRCRNYRSYNHIWLV
jgi:hypothetical protein